jgi:hypothetical protein
VWLKQIQLALECLSARLQTRHHYVRRHRPRDRGVFLHRDDHCRTLDARMREEAPHLAVAASQHEQHPQRQQPRQHHRAQGAR